MKKIMADDLSAREHDSIVRILQRQNRALEADRFRKGELAIEIILSEPVNFTDFSKKN
ncbi:MAG: hypothetical protein MUD00_02850 [Candidatus Pacebacteria bacterium]|jgi:hypothetical protein|nr:hypothetical protein [Candidatus Paceibacterota bacterium]